MRHGGRIAGILGLLLVGGCGGERETRILPDVSTMGDSEIAQLRSLPDPFDPSYRWALRSRRLVSTAPDAAEPLFFNPAQVIPLRDGTLLVYDPAAPAPLARIEPETATLLHRFGARGEGPGEIGGQVFLSETADGSFEVVDGSNRQIHRYADDGMWLGSERLEVGGFPLEVRSTPDRRGYLVSLQVSSDAGWWNELVEVRAHHDPTPFARLPEPSPGAEPGLIQQGGARWTVMPNAVVAMWTTRPSIYVHDAAGSLTRTIELPLTRRNLTDRDIAQQVVRHGGIAARLQPGPAALTNMLYPVNDTVFGMFLSDLWRAAEDPPIPPGNIYWRLFTVRGEYLGVVQQPEDFRYLGLDTGTLWARLLDENLEPVLAELELVPLGLHSARACLLPGRYEHQGIVR